MHTNTRRMLITTAAAIGLSIGGYSVAAGAAQSDQGSENDDSDTPLTGSDLDQAVSAALAETGDGRVTGTEVGDDGAAFGVEVRLSDGAQVEVNLDADFNVIGVEIDDD